MSRLVLLFALCSLSLAASSQFPSFSQRAVTLRQTSSAAILVMDGFAHGAQNSTTNLCLTSFEYIGAAWDNFMLSVDNIQNSLDNVVPAISYLRFWADAVRDNVTNCKYAILIRLWLTLLDPANLAEYVIKYLADQDNYNQIYGNLLMSFSSGDCFFKTYYLPTLKRLAVEAPFPSIQSKCREFLTSAGLVLPTQPFNPDEYTSVSDFVPSFHLKSLESSDPEIHEARRALLEDVFLKTGRIPHYHFLLCYYPKYLEKHQQMQKAALTEPGPLPECWRFYLAFMAAATHKCEYLMRLAEDRCKMYGGTSSWFDIDTLSSVPEKLRCLGPLNVKLAHRPWELEMADLSTALEVYSISELTYAVVILARYHALSSFIMGTGVLPEIDLPFTRVRRMSMTVAAECLYANKPDIARRLMNLEEALREVPEVVIGDDIETDDEADLYFEQLAGGSLQYVNYDVLHTHRRFYVSDFNWREHGFEILERLAPSLAAGVNNVINFAYSMTFNTFGSTKNIETGPLRRAVWNYTQRVYGLLYDDYDYKEVNALLGKETKIYIKKVACVPQSVTYEDFQKIEMEVTPEEKIHIALLIAEARMEGELLYWLHLVKTHLGL